MESIIKRKLQEYKIDPKKPIILAISTGIDSSCLMHILEKLKYSFVLAHINHGKREQSIVEENFLKNLALEKKINLEIFHLKNAGDKHNFHDYAHHKRYEFLYSVVVKYQAQGIFVAHHLDDHLESIIMKLITGSNLSGYSGIKEITPYLDTIIYRPLMEFSKDDIIAYHKQEQFIYFNDSSNDEDVYLRNKIRHHVIPELKKYPHIYEKSTQYRDTLLEYFDYIRHKSINYLTSNHNIIDTTSFIKLDKIYQKDIVACLLEEKKIRLSKNKINELLKIIQTSKPNVTHNINNEYQLVKSYEKIIIEKKKANEELSLQLDCDKNNIFYRNLHIYFDNIVNYNALKNIKICYNIFTFPFTVRKRKNGDVLNMSYGTKKLKDLLIDKKIPQNRRDELIVIADKNDKIIYVEGVYEYRNLSDTYDTVLIIEEI